LASPSRKNATKRDSSDEPWPARILETLNAKRAPTFVRRGAFGRASRTKLREAPRAERLGPRAPGPRRALATRSRTFVPFRSVRRSFSPFFGDGRAAAAAGRRRRGTGRSPRRTARSDATSPPPPRADDRPLPPSFPPFLLDLDSSAITRRI